MTDVIDIVERKIIQIRNTPVILDSDVAGLYGVETKRVNEAVFRNPEKFPSGYIVELTRHEWMILKSQFATSILIKGGKTKLPTAFTEKGLYMLATILKSPQATQTTLSIIETFSKIREIQRTLNQIPSMPNKSEKQRALLQKTGSLISDLIVPHAAESETSIEFNLALVKLKYRVVKKTKKQ